MTTIRDVAVRAGVSIATVSRVLNRVEYPIRSAIRERVLRAAEELDFRPSSVARALAGRETRTLALVVPDIANPYYPRLARGAEDVASQQGYALLICNTDYSDQKLAIYVGILRDKRVDGVLLAGGGSEHEAVLAELSASGLPMVAVGRHPLDVPSVRIDNVRAGQAATEYLLKLGRRRIAFLGGPRDHTTVLDRRLGYRRALRQAGLRPTPALELEGDFTPQAGERAARRLLEARRRPDGLFVLNDNMAIGALEVFKQRGVRVPREIAVIGFDDLPLAGYVEPSLSSVAVPAYELGATAARLLIQRLRGQEVRPVVWLATSIVERASTIGS